MMRTTFSIEYYGRILVPNLEQGTRYAFVASLETPHLCLFMLLEPIKFPQMYMSTIFFIFLLVSLHDLTKKVQFYSIFAGIVHIYLEWTSSLHLGTFLTSGALKSFYLMTNSATFLKTLASTCQRKVFRCKIRHAL